MTALITLFCFPIMQDLQPSLCIIRPLCFTVTVAFSWLINTPAEDGKTILRANGERTKTWRPLLGFIKNNLSGFYETWRTRSETMIRVKRHYRSARVYLRVFLLQNVSRITYLIEKEWECHISSLSVTKISTFSYISLNINMTVVK